MHQPSNSYHGRDLALDERSSLRPPRYQPSADNSEKRDRLLYILVFLLIVISYLLGREQKRRDWEGQETNIAGRENEMTRMEREWKTQREEEGRIRDSFRWTNLTPSGHCTQYGVRKYTANFFPGYALLSHDEVLTGCSNAEAIIMGRTYSRPDHCNFTDDGRYVGHWSVQGVPDCRTYFQEFQDKGCVASGSSPLHRYEAHLMTTGPEDDGQIMCNTTPLQLKGKSFANPDSCADWGKHGWWGIFFLEDSECQNLQVQSR
ncbi:hypothetical protein BDN72DRAFT_582301 [Pluteus cervinus]|uniref:Uncharacterized protein n=1 Tax=Pluteus cervinus TaxID=181527 RepID=A0ACD3AX25_9AGAR|nr:hypothetical protein BDN72DRAFT_582301 [Pluteus cervinus]